MSPQHCSQGCAFITATGYETYLACLHAEQADVLDPSYRSALKLEPDSFYWSLEVAELGILPEIARVLAPNAAGLRAERYKLNVYERFIPT